MKPTKHNLKIAVEKGLVLSIKGEYTPAEKEVRYYSDGSGHPGNPSEFYIEDINIEEGTIMDLLEWTDGIISKECNILRESMNRGTFYRNDSIWYYLEELCIKEIEND